MAKKSSTKPKRAKPPPRLTIRRNGAPIEIASNGAHNGVPVRAVSMRRSSSEKQSPARKKKTRASMKKRMQNMGGSHVAAFAVAGTAGAALNVLVVGQGWMKPTTSAGVLIGTGAATTTAGYLAEADHVMCAGVGLTAAGTFALTQHWAFDANEAINERAKKKAKEEGEKSETDQAEKSRAEQQSSASRLRVVQTS